MVRKANRSERIEQCEMQITVYTKLAPFHAISCHSRDPRTCRKRRPGIEAPLHAPLALLYDRHARKRPEHARVNGQTPLARSRSLPAATALFQPLLRTINGSRAARATARGEPGKKWWCSSCQCQRCRWPPHTVSD